MKNNNRIVVDLNKVQWARFGYRNQYGQWSDTIMKHTVRGVPFNPTAPAVMLHNPDGTPMPPETMERRAVRLGLLDRWTPELQLTLTANHNLRYTGDKAKSVWKEWGQKIFKKGNKK